MALALRRRRALDADPDATAFAEAEIAANERLSSVERLEIYRVQFWLRHTSSLVEDFPGLCGVIGQSAWERLVEGYLEDRVGLRAVVLIVDVRRGLEDDDRQLLEFLDYIRRPAVLVATKLDKLPQSQRLIAIAKIKANAGRPVVGVSSETGEGRERLWTRLIAAAGLGE